MCRMVLDGSEPWLGVSRSWGFESRNRDTGHLRYFVIHKMYIITISIHYYVHFLGSIFL